MMNLFASNLLNICIFFPNLYFSMKQIIIFKKFRNKHQQPFIHWGNRYNTLTVKRWDWMCLDTNLICWEKAHIFYIPNHLFSMEEGSLYNTSAIDLFIVSRINRKYELAMKIRKALIRFAYKSYPTLKIDDGREKRKTNKSDPSKWWIVQILKILSHQYQPFRTHLCHIQSLFLKWRTSWMYPIFLRLKVIYK